MNVFELLLGMIFIAIVCAVKYARWENIERKSYITNHKTTKHSYCVLFSLLGNGFVLFAAFFWCWAMYSFALFMLIALLATTIFTVYEIVENKKYKSNKK